MDGVIALIVAVAGFLAFDLLATYGVDSRDAMPDDHQGRQVTHGGVS